MLRKNGAPVYLNGYPRTQAKFQDFSDFEANERDTYFGEIFVFRRCAVRCIHCVGYIVLASGGLNPAISGLQDYILRHTDRYISSLLLAAVIAAAT